MCKVYIRKFPFGCLEKSVVCQQRQEEIDGCESVKVREQKLYVWLLLEEVLEEFLHKKISEVNFKKVGQKWVCDECYFSLTHCDNFVAVAVAKSRVGIDLERVNVSRFDERLASKVLTAVELRNYMSLPESERAEFLNKLWCKKEAIFKSSDKSVFSPQKLPAEGCVIKELLCEGEKYFLAIMSDEKIEVLIPDSQGYEILS